MTIGYLFDKMKHMYTVSSEPWVFCIVSVHNTTSIKPTWYVHHSVFFNQLNEANTNSASLGHREKEKKKSGPYLKRLHFAWRKIDSMEILCCHLSKNIAPCSRKIVFFCPLLICIDIYFPLDIGTYSSSLSDNTGLHKNKGDNWKQEWKKKKKKNI